MTEIFPDRLPFPHCRAAARCCCRKCERNDAPAIQSGMDSDGADELRNRRGRLQWHHPAARSLSSTPGQYPDNTASVFQRMFCQFSVGGQLTAEYRQQRCFAVFIMDIKGVITGNSLRRVGLIITQRTHTGVGPDDIVTAKLFLKCALYTFSR